MKRGFTTNWYIHRVYTMSSRTQKEPPPCNRGFDRLLLEAIDEGLSSLGDSQKQAIYHFLERTFEIEKQDIPNKIEEFANAIEEIFGYGAKLLEIQIMKRLYEKVGHDFRYLPVKDDLSFTEYVEAARILSHSC